MTFIRFVFNQITKSLLSGGGLLACTIYCRCSNCNRSGYSPSSATFCYKCDCCCNKRKYFSCGIPKPNRIPPHIPININPPANPIGSTEMKRFSNGS